MSRAAAVLDHLVPPGAAGGDDDARAWLERHGWPERRDEMWRYAPLDALTATQFTTVDAASDSPDAARALIVDHPSLGAPAHLIIVNGVYSEAWSQLDLPAGVHCDPTAAAGPFRTDDASDAFEVLNHLASRALVRVVVDDDVDAGELHLVHVSVPGKEPTASHPRIEIQVGDRARLTLVETYLTGSHAHLTNAATRIGVGVAAQFQHLRIVTGAPAGVHVGHTHVTLPDDARLQISTPTLAAGAVRHALHVDLNGAGAEATLSGLGVLPTGAHHDTTVTVDHGTDRSTSHQRFDAIVANRARSSFTGHVVVDAGTVGTYATQTNHNLLVGPRARADTRPWLEIHADDVRCTHGATVGRLDGDALFYMRSRGIPERQARSMLLEAFANDRLTDLAIASVQPWLEARLRDALDAVDGTPSTPTEVSS